MACFEPMPSCWLLLILLTLSLLFEVLSWPTQPDFFQRNVLKEVQRAQTPLQEAPTQSPWAES